MKILVSNDDGIDAPGIHALAEALKKIGEVIVVAPRTEQSAVGHKITMQNPLRVTKHFKNGELFGYSVDGTPADCIKMGIRNIIKEQPDIVVSGINHGANTAVSIIYSGTVSAAREAAIMDVPAIAISVTSHDVDSFDYAGKVAARVTELVAKNGLAKGTLLNVNVPNLPESEIKGIKVTTQSKAKWDDIYEERIDPYGKSYFWLTGSLIEVEDEEDTDQNMVRQNFVAVTPIHFDLTDYKTYEDIKHWNI
ncbi:MAG: 5'/3'-nucleotidase SurE [Ignavibacteriae bacterium]|nr:5'/3'-nucleotidase SurE [Ignavibacteriota bacterium]NOG96722.1 5'/3'-nucleotidase SurE [Ignavibacteriota bacterium]